jgi:MFS family permease
MTSLTSSPSLVALVEAADSIPVMLLALPAGALADIIDRRRLLIGTQFYLLAVAGALALFTWLDLMTAWALLGFLFALGVGASLGMPAWAAIVPELVPASDLSAAVALNSIAISIVAIGPAIAASVAAIGPWFVFLLNVLSYFGIIAVLLRWRREHHASALPAERFLGAIRIGVRFITHTRALQVVLIRGIAFFVFASATWSLLPLIVRRELGRGPEVYGILLTCIGVGAVAGAMLLPRLRDRFSRDAVAQARACCTRWPHPASPTFKIVSGGVSSREGAAWIAILRRSGFRSFVASGCARGLAAFVVV